MGKKKKLGAPREAYNPYYGKFKDESQMAKKPFFTWIFVIPGVVIGLLVGLRVQNVGLGVIFGAIMGIAIGTLLDKRLEKRKEEREGRE
ncbi:hypothetical protein [Intestinimonas sp. HCP28S3_D6]|uniref:hypothetical protein n=1 Tax=Intestinimonas sp. HCP28S3_D6 TaxID=3438942 RepID=UPI003F8CEE06